MAIKSVEKLWSGRGASYNADGTRSYTAQVRVVTDDVLDGQMAVLFAPGVPRLGLGYYVASDGTPDYQAVCTRADPRQDDASGMVWVVDCEFSTRPLPFDPGGFGGSGDTGGFQPGQGGAADDPTKKPAVWRIVWEFKSKPFRYQLVDRTAYPPKWAGQPCVNAAGEFFDPLPELEDGWPVLVYSRVEASYTFADLLKYRFAMNRDTFLGLPPYSVQCMPIEVAPENYGQGLRAYRKDYKFRIGVGDGFTWNPVVVQQGFKVKNGAGQLVNAKEKDTGQDVTTPVFLNADGTEMDRAAVVAGTKKPLTTELSGYPLVNFAPLNIVL